ncbi:FAD-dependent monooxygenase [Kaistella jeonii]|uniref:Monooxygenase n=1 Tax=Kaistella jeonii TaxID=266749 RepID=A0A0C1CUY6_9FLAO|nr:NAD(P)/FAD-dependent oxidoreductase [Kaistella jeonii]KIA88096.1 monooxygenase [Kaistella jeonii]SFC32175.1 2-polyprenyl-6-methoxyphenol hydroxylase [Kaistella jeonii]VEI95643.1 Salicylate hydroxylase [Kaistella jeonii]
MENKKTSFTICTYCQGLGKQKRRIKKSLRLRYEAELEAFEKTNSEGTAPIRPEGTFMICPDCSGSGIIHSENFPLPDENYPHVAIIGAGIGGIALAIGCLHRGIPFTIFEKDGSFNERSQGYGLTLQQARKTLENFGIFNLENGIISNHHVVHAPDGKIVGQWGMRKWLGTVEKFTTQNNIQRSNIHIARQNLRLQLLQQLGGENKVRWNHQFTGYKKDSDGKLQLHFLEDNIPKIYSTDLLVGADGIRSAVRKTIIPEEKFPLRYLGCMVILGICELSKLQHLENSLLDSETVFQTANGKERIYMMPFDQNSIMWQLSFPIEESAAKKLSDDGKLALKNEAIRRTPFHSPIPEILQLTDEDKITGYPVYDRDLLDSEMLKNADSVTLLGDAAHPMSPFKGQGANQALLDALSLVREIFKNCKPLSNWRENGIRESVLNSFEQEMLERTATKVKDSAAAAKFLHSEIALFEGDEPRGRVLKRKDI